MSDKTVNEALARIVLTLGEVRTEVSVLKRERDDARAERDDLRAQLEAEAAAPETTPDTSRVTFGHRHEGTGMVLLQHASLMRVWGDEHHHTVDRHRDASDNCFNGEEARAAHAALAEVREALNTAERDGVDVNPSHVQCDVFGSAGIDGLFDPVDTRAHRFLAREVQALVDQGLRGDDLNARVPYEVRDHRAQGADTSSSPDVGDVAVVADAIERADDSGLSRDETCLMAEYVLRALDAHRVRREGGA